MLLFSFLFNSPAHNLFLRSLLFFFLRFARFCPAPKTTRENPCEGSTLLCTPLYVYFFPSFWYFRFTCSDAVSELLTKSLCFLTYRDRRSEKEWRKERENFHDFCTGYLTLFFFSFIYEHWKGNMLYSIVKRTVNIQRKRDWFLLLWICGWCITQRSLKLIVCNHWADTRLAPGRPTTERLFVPANFNKDSYYSPMTWCSSCPRFD